MKTEQTTDYLKLAREAREAAKVPGHEVFFVAHRADVRALCAAIEAQAAQTTQQAMEIMRLRTKVEAQAAEIHALKEAVASEEAARVRDLDFWQLEHEKQAAEIERMKSGREFILRGGTAHCPSYIHEGQELIEDNAEIRVREVKE